MHSHNQTTGLEVILLRSTMEWQQSTLLSSTELVTVLAMEGNIVKNILTYTYISPGNQGNSPLTNNTSYYKIARTAPSALGIRVSQTFSVNVKGKYIVLAFHDQGSCSVLFSVAVKYYFCPETVHVGGLVNLPRKIAPANNSESVVSNCTNNAVHEQGILKVNCQSDGVWNMSSLNGRCLCMEDMENTRGECKGIYNYSNIEVQW